MQALSRGAADFNAALIDQTADEAEREAVIALLASYVYPDRSLEDARDPIVNGAMRINTDMALNRNSVMDQLDWFKSEDLVKSSISYETLVDESYVDILS